MIQKDLLTKQALPGYTGFSDIVTNQGTLRNYGFEAEVRANIINKGGFTWDMNANISSVANKIISLPYNGVDKKSGWWIRSCCWKSRCRW